MGYIDVKVGGSFVNNYGMRDVTEQFSAQRHGHADAVARAIQYLAEVVLPRATALDHSLHSSGSTPEGGFTPDRIVAVRSGYDPVTGLESGPVPGVDS